MKIKNMALKCMALASMITVFMANNVQAMETGTNNTQAVDVAPEGPAEKKYNEFNRRCDNINYYVSKMCICSSICTATGLAVLGLEFLIKNAAGSSLLQVGALSMLLSIQVTMALDAYQEINSEKLHDTMMAEKNAQKKEVEA